MVQEQPTLFERLENSYNKNNYKMAQEQPTFLFQTIPIEMEDQIVKISQVIKDQKNNMSKICKTINTMEEDCEEEYYAFWYYGGGDEFHNGQGFYTISQLLLGGPDVADWVGLAELRVD
jgi:hypothetical protein